MSRCNSEAGFTLIDALVGLVLSAALMALITDIVAGDALQTRRFVGQSERAITALQAQRQFVHAAGQAVGSATSRDVGALRIGQNALLHRSGSDVRVLLRWANGEARFSYSRDGVRWSAETDDAGQALVRFTLANEDRRAPIVWIAR